MKRVYAVGTADTKGDELAFVADAVASAGIPVVRVDISTDSGPLSYEGPGRLFR